MVIQSIQSIKYIEFIHSAPTCSQPVDDGTEGTLAAEVVVAVAEVQASLGGGLGFRTNTKFSLNIKGLNDILIFFRWINLV